MVAFRLQLFLSKTLATFARSGSSSHHPCRSFAGVLADGFASDSKQQRATPSSSTRGVEPFEGGGGGFGGVRRSRRLESVSDKSQQQSLQDAVPLVAVNREPWMKDAMDVLSKELLRIGIHPSGVMYNPTTGLQSTVAQWEAVCDHYFLPCSHGFRKGYSQQTCLKQIRRDFGGTIWYIEGKKLAKLFGSIDLRAVLRLLQQKIRAEDLDVVYNGVRISLLESPKKGITKDGFAPLGCNVVLHELDQFVMRLKRIVDRGTRMPMSPALKVVNRNSAALDTELITNPKERPILRDPPDHFLRRINYSRFADGFLIGVIGPRNLAVKIRDLVIKFLQVRLKLKLDPDNIPISRAFDTKVPFLGYLISRHPDRIQRVVLRHAGKCRTFRVHMSGGLCLLVDTQTVIRRLAEKGFCDKAGNPKPNFRYYQYPQARSVAAVASIIRGLADYYHLANSKLRFISRVTYVLRSSLAKTYAAKFKLRSSAKVYKRGGRDLSKPIKVNKDSGSKTHLFGERNSRYPAAIPYTRSRQIPRPDTKKLGKDWLPRRRRPVTRS
ncbi:unnamed protein product [Sphagnum balticum]